MIDWISGPLKDLPTNPALHMFDDQPGFGLSVIVLWVTVLGAIYLGKFKNDAYRGACWVMLSGIYAIDTLYGMIGESTQPGVSQQFNQPQNLAISITLAGFLCLVGIIAAIGSKPSYGWWKMFNKHNLQHPRSAVKHLWRERRRYTAAPLLALLNALVALTIMSEYIAVHAYITGNDPADLGPTATAWFNFENFLFYVVEIVTAALLVYLPIQRRLRRRYDNALWAKENDPGIVPTDR